jgi:hypothetical protein
MDDLEILIRQHLILGNPSPKGFCTIKCAMCNDYKDRGGFKFEGSKIGYNCFNCGYSAQFDSEKHVVDVPKKMMEVFKAFNIPEGDVLSIVKKNFFEKGRIIGMANALNSITNPPEEVKKSISYPTEIGAPRGAYKLTTGNDDPWSHVAIEYLKQRGLSPSDNNFMLANGHYEGRLIIPYYFRGKVIYWQGRALDDSIQPKYKNPSLEKDNILFNMDELYRHTDEPLFISEGATDSISIGQLGVALTGSTLTEFKVRELQKAGQRRKIVFLIDKNKNGYNLGLQALELGFSVCCFPDNVDDANHALQRHGRLWLISYIASNNATGFEGKLTIKMKCK